MDKYDTKTNNILFFLFLHYYIRGIFMLKQQAVMLLLAVFADIQKKCSSNIPTALVVITALV